MILLVKAPVPVPLLVLVVSEMVGFVDVDQTTPLTVTEEPPSDVILPPDIADVSVIDEMLVVVRVGKFAPVVKVS